MLIGAARMGCSDKNPGFSRNLVRNIEVPAQGRVVLIMFKVPAQGRNLVEILYVPGTSPGESIA